MFLAEEKFMEINVLTIDDTVITRVVSTKLLVVIISDDLKCK